jgi:hypothetical protein
MVAAAASALVACGGGGGGGGSSRSPPPQPTVLTGTVAVGAPVAGADILVVTPCSTTPPPCGTFLNTVRTDANGNFTVTVPSGLPPFMVLTVQRLNGSADKPPLFPRLRSIALRGGTANVTPFTELVVTKLVGDQYMDDNPARTMSIPTDQQIGVATQQVKSYLLSRSTSVNASASTDFITTPFTAAAGNPYDDALSALKQSLINGEDLPAVEEHMMSASDPMTDYSQLFPLAFNADCTTNQVGMPSGRVQVSLQQSGIAIGGYTYAFQATGDQISAQSVGLRYVTFLLANGDTVTLARAADGTLRLIQLSRPGGATSGCAPAGPVSLTGKWPSVFSQVKRLANTLSSGAISCTASAFTGIQDGANTISIDANGTLHVAPLGYEVTLLSAQILTVKADIAVSGGTFTTKMRTFDSTGSDSFLVNVTGAGAITSAHFNRSGQSKHCP